MQFTSTHWGSYRPVVAGGRLQALEPAPWDPDPSPLGASLAAAAQGSARVRLPAVRQGFLRAREQGRPETRPQRGLEPFVDLPWDEALDLAAAELQRVRDAHGNQAIYGGSYGWSSAGRFHHAQGQLHRFLNGFGGYVSSVDTYSLGAGRVLMPHIVADMDSLLQQHTPWELLRGNCQLFVAFGGLPRRNAQVSPGGASHHQLRDALAALAASGTRFINISPLRDDLEIPGHGDAVNWLPIRPGTDAALMLALAHEWLRAGTVDRDFLARCTVGFAAFEAQVLGAEDGVPKTAEWAAARCGIPAARIRTLAREMAGSRTLVNCAYGLQRARRGEQPFWLTVVLASMLGQIGLPGGGFGLGYGSMNNTGSGRAAFSGLRLPQGDNPVRDFIPVARIADMLLHPGQAYTYNGRTLRYPDIRLVYWAGGNVFHHHQDINRLLQAWQRPETIIVHEPWWTATARHADIVLPATTPLEREDIGSAASDRFMVAMRQAIAPVGQARDDYAIFAGLAHRLGFAQAFTEGRSARQWIAHLYEASRERATAHGVALPPFEDFWQAGRFELPLQPQPRALLADFRRDPAAHPLPTPSGRIEIHSAVIDSFAAADCAGHPGWSAADEQLAQAAATATGLHLLSHQPATRLHSQLDAGPLAQSSKVAGREPIRLHPDDAARRGIADGDVVLVDNHLGSFLAGARLSPDVTPGVAAIATGAWFDPLHPGEPGTPCRHGNPNLVTPDVGASALSQGCSAQSARVEVRRWAGPLPQVSVFSPPVRAARADRLSLDLTETAS